MSGGQLRLSESGIAILNNRVVRQRGSWMRGNAATSMNEIHGLYVGTVLTTDSTHTKGRDKFGTYYEACTSALAGNNAGHSFNPNSGAVAALEMPGMTKICFSLGRVTNMRCFIGMSSSTTLGSGIDADNLSVNSFGLQFSTARGDTTFQAVSYAGSQTTTPTTITPVANNLYELTMWWNNATAVNLNLRSFSNPATFTEYETTITTNLLAAATDLTPNFGCESISAATLAMRAYGVQSEVWSG